MTVAIWNSPIAEQERHLHIHINPHERDILQDVKTQSARLPQPYLVQRFRTQTPEVPNHIRILQVRLRIPLLGVDEGRKLQHTVLLILRRGSSCHIMDGVRMVYLTRNASLIKKMGVLFPVRSQLPSSV